MNEGLGKKKKKKKFGTSLQFIEEHQYQNFSLKNY